MSPPSPRKRCARSDERKPPPDAAIRINHPQNRCSHRDQSIPVAPGEKCGLGASDRDFYLRSVGCWDGRGFIPAKRRHRWTARSHSRLGALSGRVCVSKKLRPERWRRVAVVPQRASGQAQPFTRFAGPDQQTLRPAAAPIRRATPHPDGAMQVGGTQGRARQPDAPSASGGDEVVFIGVAKKKAMAFRAQHEQGSFEFSRDKPVYVNPSRQEAPSHAALPATVGPRRRAQRGALDRFQRVVIAIIARANGDRRARNNDANFHPGH